MPIAKPHNSFLDTDDEEPSRAGFRQEPERDKSRMYLNKCTQEVVYHVIPPANPPPALEDMEMQQNHNFNEQPMPQQSLEEVYARQKQQHNHIPMTREQPMTNHGVEMSHMPDLSEMPRPNPQMLHTNRDNLQFRLNDQQPAPLTAIDNRQQNPFDLPGSSDEHIEMVTHSYDEYGRPLPDEPSKPARTDPDGWDFNETLPEPQPQPEPPLQRETESFPTAALSAMSPPRAGPQSHRRKSSGARRRSEGNTDLSHQRSDNTQFKVRFALRGHLDVIRSVIFTGGGSPSEPEICTAGDDGVIKRWIIPAGYNSFGPHSQPPANDLDITSYFSHRGHHGAVTSLAAATTTQNFSNGGRALGDGWVFSGGQDATVRVWERGRNDPKATLDGHTDAVWALCVLPGSSASVLGDRSSNYGGSDRILLASGSADGTILIWAVSAPPQQGSPAQGSRRGGRRANSVSSGSNFPSSPQPSTSSGTAFNYTLVHHISRTGTPSPTCITPLSVSGDTFVVSYTDASILVYDARTGEEVVGMASQETYDGTQNTGVNTVVASTVGFESSLSLDSGRALSEDEGVVHGATGGGTSGVEGVVICGSEDRFVRFFDANSGMSTSLILFIFIFTLTLSL